MLLGRGERPGHRSGTRRERRRSGHGLTRLNRAYDGKWTSARRRAGIRVTSRRRRRAPSAFSERRGILCNPHLMTPRAPPPSPRWTTIPDTQADIRARICISTSSLQQAEAARLAATGLRYIATCPRPAADNRGTYERRPCASAGPPLQPGITEASQSARRNTVSGVFDSALESRLLTLQRSGPPSVGVGCRCDGRIGQFSTSATLYRRNATLGNAWPRLRALRKKTRRRHLEPAVCWLSPAVTRQLSRQRWQGSAALLAEPVVCLPCPALRSPEGRMRRSLVNCCCRRIVPPDA